MATSNPTTFAMTTKHLSGTHLSLTVKSNLVPVFFQLLGHGFRYPVNVGCSIKDLLCDQLGIHQDYLTDRIQTIFLNSKVVDNADTTTIEAGARLALSGPMPGLVGAILRSGGYYAAMRSQISHEENKVAANKLSATITIKVLNIVAKELGPIFLQRGIHLNARILQEFFDRWTADLKAGFISGELDGHPLGIEDLQIIDWKEDMVLLAVRSGECV